MNIQKINWNTDRDNFIDYLYSLQDLKYREFSKTLIPGEFTMIGIRLPILKKIAKDISKTDYEAFLKFDDTKIFELKMLKAFIIASIKDVYEYKNKFTFFLQKIDNWSICDSFITASKIIGKNKEEFYPIVELLLKNRQEFENRVAFVILLNYFVTDEYVDKIFTLIDNYESDKYYANMALAWLLSILYIKFPEKTQIYLSNHHFSKKIIKYTIRKIKDSHRVSEENKKWLKKID